ncbi:hypothetical protein MASR2M66_07070 [Chloroflexota bacterium]
MPWECTDVGQIALWAAPAIAPLVIVAAIPMVLVSPDSAVDIAFMIHDHYTGDYHAFALDAMGLMIPGVTGLGMLSHADDAYRAVNVFDNLYESTHLTSTFDNIYSKAGYIEPNEVYDGFRSVEHSEFIDLYHGTSKKYAESILEGIDPKKFGLDVDFGPAFYTSIDKKQAIEWAQWFGEDASVLHFRIPRNEFEKLKGYSFKSTSYNWYEFVTNNRAGLPVPNHYAEYDYISGTMLLNPKEYIYGSGILEAGGQQTAFYTKKSFDILLEWVIR